jgi:G3E family GTPase
MDQAAAMNGTIDVFLLTGYLGAGKSTLLQRLLQLPDIAAGRPALIINEFGQEGVDGRLFDESGWPLFEINSGSLFCVCTTAELLKALEQIVALRPGVLLIEATGVAETRDVELLLERPGLAGAFRVRANVCLVDALNFTKVAPFLRAARHQVAAADALVINKADLVSEVELGPLHELLASMNPRATRVTTVRGDIDYAFLQGLVHCRTREALAVAQPEAVYSRSYRPAGKVDRQVFSQAIQQLGGRLLRLKGHLRFADGDGAEYVETVCGRLTIRAALSPDAPLSLTAIAFGFSDGELDRVLAPPLGLTAHNDGQ